jgi:hypothetical protein
MTVLATLAAVVGLASPTAADLSWMSGYWLTCEDGQEVSETWSDPRGGLMAGHGVTLAGGRASFEMFRIAPHEDGVAYFAQPGGGPAVVFPATEATASRAVFVNPENDFPQRITYTLEGDLLTARIDGQVDGQPQAMEWRYRKAELNTRCPA